MRSYVSRSVGLLAVAVAVATVISCAEQNGESESASAVAIDADDIGGVVTSAQGPEAGVWVVAETQSLPTPFVRMVVTDDQGQYVLPDLPDASYEVFVRGYGLVDSARVQAMPGQTLNLDAVVAPDAAAAAEVYPAAWWFALADLPDGELSQRDLANGIRGCLNCHQLGNKATREIPDSILSRADSSLVAWDERTRMGPAGAGMGANFQRLGAQRELFADWTDPEAVFHKLKELSRGQPCDFTGIRDYRMIDECGGIQWPFPDCSHHAERDGYFDSKIWKLSGVVRTPLTLSLPTGGKG